MEHALKPRGERQSLRGEGFCKDAEVVMTVEVVDRGAEQEPPPGGGYAWEAGDRSISRRAYPSTKGFRLTVFLVESMRDIANLTGAWTGTAPPGCDILQGGSWQRRQVLATLAQSRP